MKNHKFFAIQLWKIRIFKIRLDKIVSLMRIWVDYNEYIRSVQEEINYAEGRIHDSVQEKCK